MSIGKSSTPLGKVRGLGSAGHGGAHWLHERLVSAALLLLGLWFIVSLLLLPTLDRTTAVEWLRAPTGAVPMIAFVWLTFDHALDGMQVVIDDYVHDEASRLLVTGIVKFVGYGALAFALFALAKIIFGA